MTEIPAEYGTAGLAAMVLGAIDQCAATCQQTLERLAAERGNLREHLQRRIRPAPEGPTRQLCAVDGTHAVVPTAGATFAAIAAVAVEERELTDQLAMVQMLPPIEELDSMLGGLRTILELRLLARRIRATQSGLFVLDGSYYSVLLEVNRLLMRYAQYHRAGARPPAWWEHFRPMLDAFFAEEDWRLILESRRVIAHPKQAASAEDVAAVAPQLSGTVTDRTLWTSVLEPGETSVPVALLSRDRPHLLTGYRSEHIKDWKERRLAIEHGYGQLYVLYYRPHEDMPAFRIELPAALIAREPLGAVLATFRAALQGETIMEPLPQFLADALCRQLGRALDATAEGARTVLQNQFPIAEVRRYLGPYRTPRS